MAHMKSMIEKGLKDMKISKLADEQIEASVSDDHYPYGLRLTLDGKTMDLLNLNVEKFKVGEEVCLECRAEVVSLRSNKEDYGSKQTMELQITHLGLEEEE